MTNKLEEALARAANTKERAEETRRTFDEEFKVVYAATEHAFVGIEALYAALTRGAEDADAAGATSSATNAEAGAHCATRLDVGLNPLPTLC